MRNRSASRRWLHFTAVVGLCTLALFTRAVLAADPLPSWNEGATKKSITDFVARVTTEGGPDFVRPEQRIATFDNDGTLWCEKPMYVQAVFIVDRLRELAPKHPEWKTLEPYRSLLAGDVPSVAKIGERGLIDVVMATHAGMSTQEFETIVTKWITTAKHPRFKRLYTDLAYQPMLELLAYLRASGFQTFIVSGGGIEFMRPWTERVYGIMPQQVVGTSVKTRFELRPSGPILMRLPEMNFVDDGPGKPIGINSHIGRKPIAAFGNSDGDLQMLQWATIGHKSHFGLIVHHTDAEREYAYDRDSPVGRLDKALDQAPERGWTVVSMKTGWKEIFPPARD